jgi:hypothetical protein
VTNVVGNLQLIFIFQSIEGYGCTKHMYVCVREDYILRVLRKSLDLRERLKRIT